MATVLESKKVSTFKKRAFRPWKPTEVGSLSESESLSATHTPSQSTSHIHTELLQKQLEVTSEQQIKQSTDLQDRLSQIENKRVTIGGFFQPNGILFLKEYEAQLEQAKNTIHTLTLQQVDYNSEYLNSKKQLEALSHALETEKLQNIQQATEVARLEDEQRLFAEHLEKMNFINLGERSLRQWFEAKAIEASAKVSRLEHRIQSAESALMLAEEKAHQIAEQASKAISHLQDISAS